MKNAMFRLLPDGNVIYSVKDPMLKTDNMLLMIIRLIKILSEVRITMLISCLMELARYPLDQQICSLKMESYSHDYKELQLYVSLKNSEEIRIDISDDARRE